ncbi:MAG: helix-turn-helix domain-containing protein [Bacteroidetes bacterium]|nr:helix-turn-helix domain-containing protein [Bacteroidota bacterium]
MPKTKLKVNADLSSIKSELRKDEKFSQFIRLHAVYQIAQGKSVSEVQQYCSASHKTICDWVHRYNTEGLAGLSNRAIKGSPASLNEEEKID